MADIKEVAQKTIKTVDSAAIAADRIKDTGIKTVREAKPTTKQSSQSVNEYGSDKIETATHKAEQATVYETEKIGHKTEKKIRKKFEQKYYEDRNPQYQNNEYQETPEAQESSEIGETQRRSQTRRRTQHQEHIENETHSHTGVELREEAAQTRQRGKTRKTIKTVHSGEVKEAASGSYKSADTSIKTVNRTTKETAKRSEQAVRAANESKALAKETAKKSAQAAKKSAEIAKEAAKKAAQAAKKLAEFLVKVFKAIAAALKELGSAIAAGGWVSVVIIIVLCLAGAIAFSIYGIFYSNEDSGTGITIHSAIQKLNEEFQQKNDEILAKVNYDKLEMSGTQANWKDVLAVYTVKLNTDPDNPIEVATIDDSKKNKLSDIFWDMNAISYHTEVKQKTIIVEVENDKGKKEKKEKVISETYLYIEHTSKTANQMAEEYHFTAQQKEYLAELLSPKNDNLWISLMYGIGINQTVNVSDLNFQNETVTIEQKKVVAVATNSASYGIPAIKGYCEGWVADVYNVAVNNRGYAYSAITAGRAWSVSKDWSQIQVGATVYGYAGNPYGHVGIYIGGGMVAHNIGGVKVESLEHWISWYNGVCWGWENGYNLSGNPKYNSVGGLI